MAPSAETAIDAMRPARLTSRRSSGCGSGAAASAPSVQCGRMIWAQNARSTAAAASPTVTIPPASTSFAALARAAFSVSKYATSGRGSASFNSRSSCVVASHFHAPSMFLK
jgi:hypothetical protein